MNPHAISCPPIEAVRPADFRARFSRRGAVTIARARARKIRRDAAMRGAALSVAAIIVAASWQVRAAQRTGVFSAITAPDTAEDNQIRPMPFETPGGSFPGSAYYYLAQDDAQTTLTPDAHGDGDAITGADTLGGLTNPGPAARAIVARGQDFSRALDCMTAAVYYEAASEPDDGQRAVAQVVLNRVAHPSFPKTVCGVVYQGSERTSGCQFTFACDGAMLRPRAAYFWDRAQQVARAALAGYVFRPVGLATHYHTFAVHPVWDDAMNFIGQIGAHRFYRFIGPAGIPAAFRFAYAGGEPMAGPHPRLTVALTAAPDAADPIALERAYEASLKQAGGQPALAQPTVAAAAAPTPAYTSDVLKRGGDDTYRAANLPEGNSVRAEYQGSGRWIGDPQ